MTAALTIYRIEHPETGLGPFAHLTKGCYGDYDALTRLTGDPPAPEQDPELASAWLVLSGEESRAFVFGFADAAVVAIYFGREALAWLAARGFALFAYRVERAHVLFGRTQVAFRADRAERGPRLLLA